MTALALAVMLAAAPEEAPAFENDLNGIDFPVSKGGTHLIGIGGVLGTTSAIVAIVAGLTRSPGTDFTISGATAAGLFTLFLGGGLTGARLLQPTPAAAWGSFWAGTAGAAVGFKLAIDVRGKDSSAELVLVASAIGYLAGSLAYLVLPDAQTLPWAEFWACLGTGALLTGIFTGIAFSRQWVVDALNLVAIASPVIGILAGRLVFAFWQPFSPWVDDLKPPFRAQPIIALSPTGASVGIAASW